MRASCCNLSKARRFPLTSKYGNKNFYKGTGSYPRLGPKRTGEFYGLSKSAYRMVPERMRYFCVPPNLHEPSELKPYVDALTPRPRPSDARQYWPVAESKPEKERDSLTGGIYGPRGFDGHYYLQLARHQGNSS